MVIDENDKKTIGLTEFMVNQLGGKASVVASYLQSVADLASQGGTRRTLGEIIEIAEQNNVKDWFLGLTLPEIAGYFYQKPEDDAANYSRRTRNEISKVRDGVLEIVNAVGPGIRLHFNEIARTLDMDPMTLKRKDLDPMVSQGLIAREGSGMESYYLPLKNVNHTELIDKSAEEAEENLSRAGGNELRESRPELRSMRLTR